MAYLPSMPKKGFEVKCNVECGMTFHLDHSNLRCKRIENPNSQTIKLYQVYYRCPHCQHKYKVCILDGYLKDVLGPKIKAETNKGIKSMLLKTYKERLDQLNGRLAFK